MKKKGVCSACHKVTDYIQVMRVTERNERTTKFMEWSYCENCKNRMYIAMGKELTKIEQELEQEGEGLTGGK